jgi:hypothetical protein
VVIVDPLANDRSVDRQGTVCSSRDAFKLNPLAMSYFPELHSQKHGNP